MFPFLLVRVGDIQPAHVCFPFSVAADPSWDNPNSFPPAKYHQEKAIPTNTVPGPLPRPMPALLPVAGSRLAEPPGGCHSVCPKAPPRGRGGDVQAAAQTFRGTGPHTRAGQPASCPLEDMVWVACIWSWSWTCQLPCQVPGQGVCSAWHCSCP